MLLHLAGQSEAESVTLPFYGLDAYDTVYVTAICRSGIVHYVNGFDVLGHKIAEFRQIRHFPSVDVICWHSATDYFRLTVHNNHPRHLAQYINGISRMLKHRACNVRNHSITLNFGFRKAEAYYGTLQNRDIRFQLYCTYIG